MHDPFLSPDDSVDGTPPAPLMLRFQLDEADIDTIRDATSQSKKATLPVYLAVLLFFAARYFLKEDLPNIVLYGLVGAIFLINTLLTVRRTKRTTAAPGAVSMTFTADGLQVGTEMQANYILWADVTDFALDDEVVLIRTKSPPPVAIVTRHIDGPTLEHLKAWRVYWKRNRPPRQWRSIILGGMALAILLVWVLVWILERF